MKKYLKFLFVAFLAAMTMSLTSCKDNNDEPNKGGTPSNSNLDSYYFTVNGEKFYYAIDYSSFMMDPELNSSVSQGFYPGQSNRNLVECYVKGFNKVPKFDDLMGIFNLGGGITESALFSIYLEDFNFNNTKEGTNLEIADFVPENNIIHSRIGLIYYDETGKWQQNKDEDFQWTSRNNIQGKVKFVSYKNGLLTLKFEDIVMPNINSNSSSTLSGTITFDTENNNVIP